MTRLSGWGRFPIIETEVTRAADQAAARRLVQADGVIPRGNGRAYGDAALGSAVTLCLRGLDRFRHFDPQTGLLTVEAGALLGDVIDAFLPLGFFPPVVPGTRFVTVGGAIAADVHGKNHHLDGGFGDHVESLVLATADGGLLEVSRTREPDVFAATVGGMGLTGAILEATLRLRTVETGWITQRTVVAPDLAAAVAALDAAGDSPYAVAWIDALATGRALGRSLVFLGAHTAADAVPQGADRFPPARRPRLGVPMDPPFPVLNRLSVRAFNEACWQNGRRHGGRERLTPVDPYFFPLDGVAGWNRIYGRRGLAQHQCVLPLDTGPAALAEVLERATRRGDASFFAVLKRLGQGGGLLSFPRPGYTLALDFPVSDDLPAFLDDLDRVVVRAGGRLYLAKDARQSRATFEAGYPQLGRFREVRRALDPAGRIRSRLSDRLGLS